MPNTAGVPNINSFTQAKTRYEQTPPIRGHADKVRPLGYRKYHHMASIAMPDADTVVFKYYDKPFVTWHSDNTFTVTNGVYQSAYSARHLMYFLPRQWRTGWVDCAMTINKNNGKNYFIPLVEPLNFAPTGDDFELVNKPVAFSIRKKRNSLKHELAQQQPFMDWLTVVMSVAHVVGDDEVEHASGVLRGELGLPSHEWYSERRTAFHKTNVPHDPQEYLRHYEEYSMSQNLPVGFHFTYASRRKFHTAGCERLLQWVSGTDADKWVLAMNLIAGRAGRRRYLSRPRMSGANVEYHLELGHVMSYLQEVTLHAHRDTAFYREQLPDGVLPSRTNRHYFQVVNLPQ